MLPSILTRVAERRTFAGEHVAEFTVLPANVGNYATVSCDMGMWPSSCESTRTHVQRRSS
jgi:hypothetical protein